MKKPFRAQSTLEFIMIIILVLAGVVVMGPYVIRSINAYLHSWEVASSQARNKPDDIENYVPGSGSDPDCPMVSCRSMGNYSACRGSDATRRCCIWIDGYVCSGTNGFGGDCYLPAASNQYPSWVLDEDKSHCEWRSIALNRKMPDGTPDPMCSEGYDPPPPDPDPTYCENKFNCSSHSCSPVGQFACCGGAPDRTCSNSSNPDPTCPPGGETNLTCSADCWCGNHTCDWYETPDSCPDDCASQTCPDGLNCALQEYQTSYGACTAYKQSDGRSCCVWVKKYACSEGVSPACSKVTYNRCVLRVNAATNAEQCAKASCSSWYDNSSRCCNHCACEASASSPGCGSWQCSY